MNRLYLKIGGYAGFALVSLLLSLYLTFDYGQLKPMIKSGLESATGAKVEIGDLSSYRLSGISIRNIKMQFKGQAPAVEGEDKPPSILTMEKIKVRLKLLPLLIGRKSLSFNALFVGGRMDGSLSSSNSSLRLSANFANLMLDRIPMGSLGDGNFRLGGKMDGKLRLKMPDTNDPAGWKGEMDVGLEAGKVFPFSYAGINLPEIKFSSGELKIMMDEGKANIEPLKLKSPDLPIDLTGALDLRLPWKNSFLDITGTINPSPKFQKQVPFISSVFQPNQAFSYKGNLDALLRTF